MGRDIQTVAISREHRARFRERLRDNLEALRRMVDEGHFRTRTRRVGLELEVNIVGPAGDPLPVNTELLELLGAAGLDFSSEVGRFNVELATPPLPAGADLLSRIEATLRVQLGDARGCAEALGGRLALIGILPSLTDFDLAEQSLSVNPRYAALNDAMLAERGDPFRVRIQGQELLDLRVPSVAYAAACTSVQVHLEVTPGEFAAHWNGAQAAAGPLVAAAANSPLFLGRRLHHETRIALFEQVCDTRSEEMAAQGVAPRVWFGGGWLRGGAVELFEQNVHWFAPLLPLPDAGSPLDALASGTTPRLAELSLHSGTIYRWTRPVYGVDDDGPNLRIEIRPLPAGPTVADVVANVAFALGLTHALAQAPPLADRWPFELAEQNFRRAARDGIRARLSWPGVLGDLPASELLLRLLPLAAEGLADLGVAAAEARRRLAVVEARAHACRNGATWQLGAWAALRARGTSDVEAGRALVRAYLEHAATGRPVHEWPDALPA